MAPRKRPRSKHLAEAAKRRLLKNGGEEGDSSKRRRTLQLDDEFMGDAHEDIGPSSFGQLIDTGLDRFEAFYRQQKLVSSEGEWAKLRNSLRQPLPVAFRICKREGQPSPQDASLRQELDALLEELEEGCNTARGRRVPPCRRFDFADAIALACDQKVLRQEQREAPSAVLARFANWLNKASAQGFVSRQEIVSAVPVSVLTVRPGHRVLDMCASPGSKTLQALELVSGPGANGDVEEGAVVANEIAAHRSHVLARRCSVLGPPAAALAVVQHRAQAFPGPTNVYDRIICDVPCSGDGAIRKNPEKWRSWTPQMGRQLHSLQLQIALRAAALLKPGGLLSYSTCSFNPLENEAVVAALLKATGGALELVECPKLGGLSVRPGLETWKVVDDDIGLLASLEDARARLPREHRRRYRKTMWPPTNGKDLNLRRCLRLMPFLQNTGGFFVALLRKKDVWPVGPCPGDGEKQAMEAEKTTRSNDNNNNNVGESRPSGSASSSLAPCPSSTLEGLSKSLGSLPASWPDRLLVRGSRKVHLCSAALRHLLLDLREGPRHDRRRRTGSSVRPGRKLGVVAAGVAVAARKKSDTSWRPTPVGSAALALWKQKDVKALANAQAAKKLSEGHLCAACKRLRPGSCYSRKMLTRPPAKRKCQDCVTPAPAAKKQ